MADMIQPAVHEYPRNVCVAHRLCSAVDQSGAMCGQLAESNEHYCAEHGRLAAQQRRAQQKSAADQTLIKQTCNGTTKKGKRCKTKGAQSSMQATTSSFGSTCARWARSISPCPRHRGALRRLTALCA